MQNDGNQARLAALWMMHGTACAKLLRANGRDQHARNLEAAYDELMDILAVQVGRDRLAQAMDWASSQVWGHDDSHSGGRH